MCALVEVAMKTLGNFFCFCFCFCLFLSRLWTQKLDNENAVYFTIYFATYVPLFADVSLSAGQKVLSPWPDGGG